MTRSDDRAVGEVERDGGHVARRPKRCMRCPVHPDVETHDYQITTHNDKITTHDDQITTHNDQITTHNDQITTHNDQITTYNDQNYYT